MGSFFSGKKVFITGHTGFKGAWLCRMLLAAGAEITGYALAPAASPNLFALCGVEPHIRSIIADIRDKDALQNALSESGAELVIHMAAQPLVLEGYNSPADTYEVNVMGTVNILECVRHSSSVRSFLNVTTDKVYQNREWDWGYREIDRLGGSDPYSNSKACSELVTHAYAQSFSQGRAVGISTARAGNVIGGGDFAEHRIVPDCIRAVMRNEAVTLRNPHSVRPYQHVLDALAAYLRILEAQYHDTSFSGSYNVGPDEGDIISTLALAKLFCSHWGDGATWKTKESADAPHESGMLKLDCSLMKKRFGWRPVWNIDTAMKKTVEWTRAYLAQESIAERMDGQIRSFAADSAKTER